MLPIEPIKINEGQYLSDTDEFLNGTPNNTIIFKKLPNIGGTHGECKLYDWRNSIIIEPNTPVLKGKKNALEADGITKMYPNIFVVHKGVTRAQVVAYLNSDITPKKILSTPEGYANKVKPAIESSAYSLYDDFFMLFDECDRMIKDADFRDTIILPMHDFFKFKEKAMISATAIEPIDPRFQENGFRILQVEPQFDYRKPITIVNTNRVFDSIKEFIANNRDKKVFIFLNSIEFIFELIQALDIEKQSKVFCSPEGCRSLRAREFNNVDEDISEFLQYNFFTSRFFNAVDIKLDYTANVLMITDVYRAPFSKLDPYTDAIQIVGRFRNGTNKISHISNFNAEIKYRERGDAIKFVDEQYEFYKGVCDVADSHFNEGGIVASSQALDGMDITKFVNEEGKLNSTMVDNFILDQTIKSHYRNYELLNLAYLNTTNFNPIVKNNWFDIGDSELDNLRAKKNMVTLAEAVAKILDDHNPKKFGLVYFYLNGDNRDIIRREYPEISKFYDYLGYKKMKSLNFEHSKMKKAVEAQKRTTELKNSLLFADIHSHYQIGEIVMEQSIKPALQQIYLKHGISQKAKSSHINNFFKASRSGTRENQKFWTIQGLRILAS
ncbi:DEAD/DEAH box helicase family protein [Pedobacter borealis]|uniref:DEAD/DEAH box helicase family protein n=1 Tax=Pedobacter borealis TaxID=475254 RepID=UPI0004935DA8|nr:DEAD/DEAH box helicase family protein [Pedobacter borealis]